MADRLDQRAAGDGLRRSIEADRHVIREPAKQRQRLFDGRHFELNLATHLAGLFKPDLGGTAIAEPRQRLELDRLQRFKIHHRLQHHPETVLFKRTVQARIDVGDFGAAAQAVIDLAPGEPGKGFHHRHIALAETWMRRGSEAAEHAIYLAVLAIDRQAHMRTNRYALRDRHGNGHRVLAGIGDQVRQHAVQNMLAVDLGKRHRRSGADKRLEPRGADGAKNRLAVDDFRQIGDLHVEMRAHRLQNDIDRIVRLLRRGQRQGQGQATHCFRVHCFVLVNMVQRLSGHRPVPRRVAISLNQASALKFLRFIKPRP